jgi:hypothetical protein
MSILWKPKENVCWVGDSITANGGFEVRVMLK